MINKNIKIAKAEYLLGVNYANREKQKRARRYD